MIRYWTLLVASALLVAQSATAQPQPTWGNSGSGVVEKRIRCDSLPGRDRFCAAPNDGRVRFVRQHGGNQCVEGSTWRHDTQGIHVRYGCRGEFAYMQRVVSGGWDDGNVQKLCASVSGRENFCPIENRGVRLLKTESNAPCIEGQSWRSTNSGIYVRNGCRAVFEVRSRYPGGDGWGGGGDGWGPTEPLTLRCESIKHRWAACPVDIGGRVQVIRQESRAPCTRDWTWGTLGDEAIWVSDGCRAVFRVDGGRAAVGKSVTSGEGGAPPGIQRKAPK